MPGITGSQIIQETAEFLAAYPTTNAGTVQRSATAQAVAATWGIQVNNLQLFGWGRDYHIAWRDGDMIGIYARGLVAIGSPAEYAIRLEVVSRANRRQQLLRKRIGAIVLSTYHSNDNDQGICVAVSGLSGLEDLGQLPFGFQVRDGIMAAYALNIEHGLTTPAEPNDVLLTSQPSHPIRRPSASDAETVRNATIGTLSWPMFSTEPLQPDEVSICGLRSHGDNKQLRH